MRTSDATAADDSPAAAAFDAVRANLPVIVEEPPKPSREPSEAAFAAQVMGQGGQKRGLRGGQPVLQQARSAYLEAEWSGPQDRRPPSGAVTCGPTRCGPCGAS